MTEPVDDGRSTADPGSRWIPWIYTGGVLLLALAFYREFVFQPGRMLFGTDMLDQAYQLREFGLTEVRQGRGVPLWNPFVYSGLPYLAILPGPVFYPTSLLYLLMPLYRAIGWTFVLHTFLAGGIGYFAARRFRLDRQAAAITGLAFMFTGYVVSLLYGGHDGRMFAMILFPLVLALVEEGLEDGRYRWFLAAGMVMGLQILTPHAQVMYYSSLMVAAFAAFRLWERWRESDRAAALLRPAGYVASAFLLAAAVGAVQILPTLGMMEHGVRGGGTGGYEFASSWALPPQELTALVLPDLVGSLDSYWGSNPFKLHTEYLGAVPLALALLGAAARIRRRTVWFLVGASTLGILFSLGAATPVHRIAYEIVPLVDRFRAPAMMLGPVSFLICLLAGHGWQAVLDRRRGGADGIAIPWVWVWTLSTPVLFLALAAALAPESLQRWVHVGWYPSGWERGPGQESVAALRANGWLVLVGWGAALGSGWAVARRRVGTWIVLVPMVLLVGELWRVDARYLETADPEGQFSSDAVVDRMQEGLGPGERAFPLERSYGPNELMYWDVPSVTGSQNFRLAWYDRLVGGVSYENLMSRPVLWQLLDVRYLTTRSEVQTPLLEPVARSGRARLYRVVQDAPHAFFPRRVVGANDTTEALRRTLDLESHAAAAVVDADGPLPPAGEGDARLERLEGDVLELTVQARKRGLLVLSEIYHPNWKATLDGQEIPVHRVNVALRGVVVPEGTHRLEFRYESGLYRAGLAITSAGGGIGVAALLIWVVAGLRRRRAD
jgi:hypothetical protein